MNKLPSMPSLKPSSREGKILIIEDNLDIQLSAKLLLKPFYAEVLAFDNPSHAISHIRGNNYDVILLDMNFSRGESSGNEGILWLKKIMELSPQSQVIMMTAYGDIELAIKAIKFGAIDFVLKPWQNEKLLATVSAAFKLRQTNHKVEKLEASNKILTEAAGRDYHDFIGDSPSMKKVFEHINKVAATDANVLILGENGTGKELVARAIHRNSLRSNEVFIKVDLGAIPDTLFESELFGHKKGAFTDAREDRAGRFELANHGTLFLDEIGNLSFPLQSKLLTAIQSRQVARVGSNIPVGVDIRLICATNMPLYQMSEENNFRKDLLYRINTVEINLPPLRERREDIPLLVGHYLKIYSKKYLKPKLSVGSQGMRALVDYRWPGNIRELQHAVERAVILSDGDVLQPTDFPIESKRAGAGAAKLESLNLEEMERSAIKEALIKYKGNISHAAKELGLTRAALYRRLEKYGI